MRMASTQIDLISKKKQIARAAHFFFLLAKSKFSRAARFFVFPLPLFCTTTALFVRLKRQTSKLHIIFMEEFSYVVYPIFCFLRSCSLLLFTAAHFRLAGH